ncbi:MAG TPA: MFS transporter [Actinocrinis sp.]|uniref:MFS transporter n=1 Tax=Actinocrinis sp. TaxID=1920516 RepID=UPI002DDCFABE|nr:MFS transporter [Actinocrinis sp.]HEV3173964.1 MFS transporter [Actinocrinis sp.]
MQELTYRRRMLILAICCMSLLIVAIDNTIVNVALPSIQRDLHAPVSGLQWIIDAYTLVLASLLMLAGSMGDRLGRRKVFQTGLVLFTVASLLCSLAPSLSWLVGFRTLQAVGGSMLNPVAMSIISNTFTDARERARAIGVWGGVVGLSMAAGPVVGGLLVQLVGWRSIFWVNIPVGVLAVVLTALFVPESRAARARRPDPLGQLLVIVLLASLTYAIIEGPGRGWASPEILGLFALSAVTLVALVRAESRRSEPLIDLRFFRSIPFSGATVIAVAAFIALAGFLFLNTLYLQEVRGYTALHAGLLTLPMAAVTAITGPLSGRLVARRGSRLSLLAAGGFLTLSALLLELVTPTSPVLFLGVVYALFGLGFGMVNPPITNTAVSGMPRAQAGVAAAVASTSRQVGQSLGVAVIGSVVASQAGASLRTGFTAAGHISWAILAGCGVLVTILAVVTTGPRAIASADRAAALFPESGPGQVGPAPQTGPASGVEERVEKGSGAERCASDVGPGRFGAADDICVSGELVITNEPPDAVTVRVAADGSPETET